MVLRLKLGSSTARLWTMEWDFTKALSLASEYFKVVELWVEPPYYPNWRTSREKADLDKLLDILVVTELETTIHAPYHDLSLCSWNPIVNSASLKEVEKTLEMAEEIGSKTVTFHAGRMRLDDKGCLDVLKTNLEALNDHAKGYSSKLCLENPQEGYLSDIGNLLKLTKGFKNIYITLDLAHLSLRESDLGGYKTELKRKLKNVHLSALAKDGKHRPLLKETPVLKKHFKVLKGIGYKGAVILEGKIEDKVQIAREITAVRKLI